MTDGRFSCFVVGADTLLMECTDVLLAEGHLVKGVITATKRIREWAEDKGLRVLDAVDSAQEVAQEEFDYLFSITHPSTIPDDILALPRKLAIKFHDGPHSRYAGFNAPAWALMRGEREYGVTWHVISAGVERGDVLKRKMFEVTSGETSLSINTKGSSEQDGCSFVV